MLLTFAAQFVLVVVTTWLVWTETASPMVTGLQGRYFLPALICGVLGIAIFATRPFVATKDRVQTSASMMPSFVAVGALLLLGAAFVSALLGEFYGLQGFKVICLHELCKSD